MKFTIFKQAVNEQFKKMAQKDLFVTSVNKDSLWETYLNSFPKGSNPIYRERTEHDCQCCKQFIRACGNVVSIDKNLKLVSIWDIDISKEEPEYQEVADHMSNLVKSKMIYSPFMHYQSTLGTNFNHEQAEPGIIPKRWDHFYFRLPKRFVNSEWQSIVGSKISNNDVFLRGITELTINAIDTVIELIDQNSLYRGQEHKSAVQHFKTLKKLAKTSADKAKTSADKGESVINFAWKNAEKPGARIKNTVIGTLLTDISENMDLTEAVKLFESKVAPANYKRPKAVITKRMIEQAEKKVKELGIENSLQRRFAILDDITVPNTLFVNRDVKKAKNIFDTMKNEAPDKKLSKVEEVNIKDFINDILPKAESIEVMMENKHISNLMSLIAPVDANAPNILKWRNNFSWEYNGEMADSMKQNVKKAGGRIDADFRFSIQWNDADTPGRSDLDAWCGQPSGRKVYFGDAIDRNTGCFLDVDIRYPGKKIAVENIIIPKFTNLHNGVYQLIVHNFRNNTGNTGFKAEFEYKGDIYSYEYNKSLRQNEEIVVATIDITDEGLKFVNSLDSNKTTKEVWGVNTNTFQPVSIIMNSPNHWDGEQTGNKHIFFILENCLNPDKGRGFFNEFLSNDLQEHRKVFEVLGSKLKTEKSNQQLSGLGFSSTQRNSIFCKVKGNFSRQLKINF